MPVSSTNGSRPSDFTQEYGTHSLRRTKASIIYKATGNLRAVQILLGTATFAHEHLVEGRIYYRFHPRCGETVLIKRQLEYRGVELVVILQPDSSLACIPAWMTHEAAAQYTLSESPVSPSISCDPCAPRSMRF